jgi:XapX domain-containing protein
MDLKPYLISLAIGLLVGVLYALLNTRSPAPPIIALLGLLGMLIGESVTSWAKSEMSFAKAAEHCLHAKDFSAGGPEGSKAQDCEKTAA